MALFQGLFSTKSKGDHESRDSTSCSVRILLVAESPRRGRRLLADSASECSCRVCEDATTLTDMALGAVTVPCTDSALKIHILHTPHRLMCTKLWGAPSSSKGDSSRSLSSTGSSIDRIDSGFVAGSAEWNATHNPRYTRADTSWSSTGSWRPSSDLLMPPSPSNQGSASGSSATCSSGGSGNYRRTRLALCVILPLPDLDASSMIALHAPQLDALLSRARVELPPGAARASAADLAPAMRSIRAIAAAWSAQGGKGARDPLWLSMAAAGAARQRRLADGLVADLCTVISKADTKHTNFFVSTLLTHVLTHHVGWVRAVSPYARANARERSPYAALRSQLRTLSGARTVLTGGDRKLLTRLLSVLSYFVRCGEVRVAASSPCLALAKRPPAPTAVTSIPLPQPVAPPRAGGVVFTLGDEEPETAPCCQRDSPHLHPKHSGFKFDFDKYPQIVTNYMRSKNLEILDRTYIGKPGNIKLDRVPAPPPPPTASSCERCRRPSFCLQTPTNASELWSDVGEPPQPPAPQRAKRVSVTRASPEKHFIRCRRPDTVVVNPPPPPPSHLRVLHLPLPPSGHTPPRPAGLPAQLVGGLDDSYDPGKTLQGTTAPAAAWEPSLRRTLAAARGLGGAATAIVADADSWTVRVYAAGGAGCAGGMSALVGAMLDALPALVRARVPAPACLSFVERRLREMVVHGRALAELVSSRRRCDVAAVTRALRVDVNDVPLLLAVAAHLADTRVGVAVLDL